LKKEKKKEKLDLDKPYARGYVNGKREGHRNTNVFESAFDLRILPNGGKICTLNPGWEEKFPVIVNVKSFTIN